MESKRNKHIAISVLKGMTYDNAGILHDISRERVYQITRRVITRLDPEIAKQYNIKSLRLDSNRLISLISEL
jgi:hypothetical protein